MFRSLLCRTGLAALLLGAPAGLAAQELTLSAKSGDLKVEGTLLEYDGEFYRVETEFGPLTVDARTVDCAGDGCPTPQETSARFAIAGDSTVALPLIEAFAIYQGAEVEIITGAEGAQTVEIASEAAGPLATIELAPQDDGDPYSAMRDGSDTLVFSTLQSPDPARTQVIGLDAVVVAASDVNPVDGITMDQMRRVLAGEISNWKDLGGSDSALTLHVANGDGSFQDRLATLGLAPQKGVAVQEHARLKDMADVVANDPFGIAVLPFSQLRTARPMGLRGSCGMYNAAKAFTLQSGSYPMTYGLSVTRPAKRMPLFAREFLEFLRSPQAQAVMTDLGFADMGIATLGLDEQGQRLANSLMIIGKEVPLSDVREMTGIMSGAKRLSATFRFQPGSTRLDAQSRENAEHLAAGLILGNYADKIVYLMGFSDGDGRARQNKSLSKKRAEAVQAALIAAAPDGSLEDVDFRVHGYGEASPLVCEDTAADAEINRRVEVWVKDREE
ncbi:phosphate ABC transporter substrate-binding/OmpA family protein [Neptunicoccus cionae]|uniref:OmpA family protein n=1 Tax=Neptunicoccus cionae TaxID=2035344 RepID=A0A916R0E5_9RHOB|nr:phosphate ABC transporter substrate-binding/OmpA family protein [Amylibacter cionae]GGA18564.1 OmpA family protein [Amylibacter cionae]